MDGFLRTYADGDLQPPMDAAVVIPTLLRPHLIEALHGIFAQRFPGRIHILVGIDTPEGDVGVLDAACVGRPSHCVVQVLWPGYSTSVRHGGVTQVRDGGALRAILSHLANSPYVAYLDDDNWWHEDHLRQMRQAIATADWAFSLRWFVHPVSRRPICVDRWESVGPGRGIFRERFGGFVDPNCLMINKLACPQAPHLWNFPLPGDATMMTADRTVFGYLAKHHRGIGTDRPTVFYELNDQDGLHPTRLQLIGPAYDEAASASS